MYFDRKWRMRTLQSNDGSPAEREAQFRTTRWTRVCQARQRDTPSAAEALSQLCRGCAGLIPFGSAGPLGRRTR